MYKYPELADLARKVEECTDILSKIHLNELDDAEPFKAEIVKGVRIKNKQLVSSADSSTLTNAGLIGNKYYLYQKYLGDGTYYGYMYFSTGTKGEYVRIPFYTKD